MQKGKFIIFEGMDYSGKTTNIKSMCEVLDAKGIKYITTREPGGSLIGEKIRDLILSTSVEQAGLNEAETTIAFQLARSHHCRVTIQPALDSGVWVICDRYIISSMVYQHAYKDIIRDLTKSLNIIEPDFMIYNTCGHEETLRRKGIRGVENHMDEVFTKYYEKLAKLFDQYAETLKDVTLTLDTNQNPSILKDQMEEYIDKILGEYNV